MAKVNPEITTFARIKVIGVGGSGKNAVNHMIQSGTKDIDFIAVNTDAQDLHQSLAPHKVHIGKNLTKGLGAGMNPEVGKRAAEETREELQGITQGADMIFITCGMGGGTGTGAGPVVARVAKESGALTVGVVTKPFTFEGIQRMRLADEGLRQLAEEVDALIIVPNDRLLATVDKSMGVREAFALCNDILRQAVEGISGLITTPGEINLDFADIRAVLQNAGSALMGIGVATGEKRAEEAALAAINSPLLELSINGARGVLFAISGGSDITLHEVQDAARVITESIDPEAKVIFGMVHDDSAKKGELKVTVVAAGFTQNSKKTLFESRSEPISVKTPSYIPPANETPKKNDGVDKQDQEVSTIPAFLRREKK